MLHAAFITVAMAVWHEHIGSDCMGFPRGQVVQAVHKNRQLDICLGMMAYEGPKTISATMASWSDSGILDMVAERIMFIQGSSTKRWQEWLVRMANKYKFRVILSPENVRFQGLFIMDNICNRTNFLFLEDDWRVAPGLTLSGVYSQLSAAASIIATGRVHGVRMRHVRFSGAPNWKVLTWAERARLAGHDIGAVTANGGPANGRRLWGNGLLYSDMPCPDCYIVRDLGDSPPRPVKVTHGAYDAPVGPKCQAWRCARRPVLYCMNTSAYDLFYAHTAANQRPKYVPFSANPTMWRSGLLNSRFGWARHSRGTETAAALAFAGFESAISQSAEWSHAPGMVIARGVGIFQHGRIDRGRDL